MEFNILERQLSKISGKNHKRNILPNINENRN
jgi:hypothetical protein